MIKKRDNNSKRMRGIKEFLRQFVLERGVGPRLYLNFLFWGSDVDDLCPGRDIIEAYGIVPPACRAML